MLRRRRRRAADRTQAMHSAQHSWSTAGYNTIVSHLLTQTVMISGLTDMLCDL